MAKIVTVIGARPQFVKMAVVSKELKRRKIKEIIIHTGQHYDRDMSELFFEELKIPRPHYNLNVGSGSHGEQTAKMIIGIEQAIKKERPQLVLLYGDTNSTLSGAIAASKLKLKIAHVEAGLRSFNKLMAEEINRIITDRVSDILFCPTACAVTNLKNEGIKKGVYLVGDVMYDSLKKYSGMLKKCEASGYILCTIHRAENADNPQNLRNIFKALGMLGRRVIIPLHPRTLKNMKKFKIKPASNIEIRRPASYFNMLSLEKFADLIITDSGGVQKEALIFNVPCVTLRDETEWLETLKSGMNVLAGADKNKIVNAARKALLLRVSVNPEKFYGKGSTSGKIVDIIEKNLRA